MTADSKPLREVRAWACVYRDAMPVIWTIRALRKEAISAAVDGWSHMSWDELRKRGWRCIRVRIVPEAADE